MHLEVGRTPVTQQLFEDLLGYAPSYFSGAPHAPVESVSFHEAAGLCNEASRQLEVQPAFIVTGEGRDVRVVGIDSAAMRYGAVRVLSAAEWEWACLAGCGPDYWWGSSSTLINDHAWWRGNSGYTTVAVDAPGHTNSWGLVDMIGNVWEWCIPIDLAGVGRTDIDHPWKGGSWHSSNSADMVAGASVGSGPDVRSPGLGFRIARSYFGLDELVQSS